MGADTLLTRFVLQEMHSKVWLHTKKKMEEIMSEEELSDSSSSTPHDTVGLTPDPVLSDWSVEYSPKSKRNS